MHPTTTRSALHACLVTLLVTLPLLPLSLGCSDDDADTHDAGAGNTIQFTYKILGQPADGFVFCNTDAAELGCATSDDQGWVTLEVPASANIALTVDRDGFAPTLYHYRTGSEDLTVMQAARFLEDARREQQTEALGAPLDEAKGVLVAYVASGGGGTARLEGSDAMPYYWELGGLDTSLQTIRSGAVAFYNLEPGVYRLVADVPDRTCSASPISWPNDTGEGLRVRVVAGRWSWNNNLDCKGEPTSTGTFEAYADTAACEASDREHLEPDCWACHCAQCLASINNCGAEPGCIDVVQCAAQTGCMGDGCYTPDTCQRTLDGLLDGPTGQATIPAEAWGACAQAECADICQ